MCLRFFYANCSIGCIIIKMNTKWNKIYKAGAKNYSYYDLQKPHEDMPFIAQFFKEQKAEKILDLGCGSGRNALFLAKNGFKVWGIDNAQEGLNTLKNSAQKSGANIELTCADIYKKLPYKDNSFDAVISLQVLQHNKRSQIQNTINELQRVLKPNGFLFITVCGRYSEGKTRYCLVKTAKKIAENTYVPTIGDETGLIHFIYNKKLLLKDFKNFKKIKIWKDSKDYYALLAQEK